MEKSRTTPHSHPARKTTLTSSLNLAQRSLATPKSGVLSHKRSLPAHIHRYYDYYNKKIKEEIRNSMSEHVAVQQVVLQVNLWHNYCNGITRFNASPNSMGHPIVEPRAVALSNHHIDYRGRACRLERVAFAIRHDSEFASNAVRYSAATRAADYHRVQFVRDVLSLQRDANDDDETASRRACG